jgi:hypothetical protein
MFAKAPIGTGRHARFDSIQPGKVGDAGGIETSRRAR